MCETVVPLTTVPSPKLIDEEVIVPSASFEAADDAVTANGTLPVAGVTESAATGGCGAVTVTVLEEVVVRFKLSVTVACTV